MPDEPHEKKDSASTGDVTWLQKDAREVFGRWFRKLSSLSDVFRCSITRGGDKSAELASVEAERVKEKRSSQDSVAAARTARPLPQAASTAATTTAGDAADELGTPRRGLGESISSLARDALGHFPFCIVEKDTLEGPFPLADTWYKLLALFLLGGGLWVLASALTGRRYAVISIVVALLMALGVLLILKGRFGLEVGVVAVALVALALMIGEIIVQQLYRAGIIRLVDVASVPVSMFKRSGVVYRSYYFNLIVIRLLPSLVVAFLVGWWPIASRPGWKGFSRKGSSTTVRDH